MTPWVGKLVPLPSLVHAEVCEMVTFRLVKLGFLLVCFVLLFLRAVENSLYREH